MTDAEKIKELEQKLKHYEHNGAAKLFYALNRKMSEMADRLNSISISTVALDDPRDKTFDRLKVIWNDAASIATAVKALGETAGVTNDETADTSKAIYKKVTSPESMADSIGELAGRKG